MNNQLFTLHAGHSPAKVQHQQKLKINQCFEYCLLINS